MGNITWKYYYGIDYAHDCTVCMGWGDTTPLQERPALPFMEMQELSAVYMVTTGMPTKQLLCGLGQACMLRHQVV